MIVARIKSLKEETHTLTELRDLENIVINTMGEDTWIAIMDFTQDKVEELEEEIRYLKNDMKCDDGQLYALRAGVREEVDFMKSIMDKITETKRLDRKSIIENLQGIIRRLEDNEGYC